MTHCLTSRRTRQFVLALSLLALLPMALSAQSSSRIEGTVVDVQSKGVADATVTATNTSTNAVRTVRADSSGAYFADGLTAGTYSISVSATGFATVSKTGIVLADGQTQRIPFTLAISTLVQQVEVNAGIDSIAAETAPSGGFLEERSAQSLISNTYIENFTAPIADFGEIVQIVPGAFTTSSNGVGLGQSKTYFRGFPDGEYDIDFDGIPFYDTNTPTHHSWAFFPSQWTGGVDFDRSPGTASTIGPAPFGGTIHLLSKPLTNEFDMRGTVSYGTWNTKLYDAAFNSGAFGLFGSPAKSNLFVDWHRMTSDGYQTFNYNMRNAGSLLYQYQLSPKTVLTGFSGVLRLNSNGPNISSTNCMLFGPSPAYSGTGCANAHTANGLQPFTGAGIKFLLTNNSDPFSWFAYQYNQYQVPTDFEYVGIKSDLGKGWYLDVKPYTYNYDNGELYSNATPIVDSTNPAITTSGSGKSLTYLLNGSQYYLGTAIAPCDFQVIKKGVAALPCGIDKYNSYRKYGETSEVTQTSGFGVFRAGFWYEWARTNRHQYPSDPVSGWVDQPLPKFNEEFWTNSYQPFGEYEFHVAPKFNITPGVKFAGYTFDILHHADDGATVGLLSCTSTTAACAATVTDTGTFTAWLPSLDLNYRVLPSWAIYGQVATGSVVPASATYDYLHTPAAGTSTLPTLATPPKQQKNTTYQIGSVYKGQKLSLDADAYHIRFQSGFSSTIDNTGDANNGDTIYYLQPSSVSRGVEFETTMVLAPGVDLYLNATAAQAFYEGEFNANTTSTAQTAPVYEKAPQGLWVQQTPADTELQGLTYQKHGFDLGIFNKRVGKERLDNGQYHDQALIAPFSSLGGYFNYTIRNRSLFDGTKIRLDGTNLLDAHNIQGDTLAGSPQLVYLNGGGACSSPTAANPCDAFLTNGPTPVNGADAPSLMAGRSFSVSVTFGFAPRESK
ncbi:MAG: TonB-dependent receptor [Terracidiphilus sp.]